MSTTKQEFTLTRSEFYHIKEALEVARDETNDLAFEDDSLLFECSDLLISSLEILESLE